MLSRIAGAAERRPIATLLSVGALFLVTYLAALEIFRKPDGRIVIGDAVHYYVYLSSAAFDRDLHFRNDYVDIYGLKGGEPGTDWVYEDTPTRHVRNMMAIGTPVVWAPAYLLGAGALWALSAVGLAEAPTGFDRLLQATAGVSGVVAAIAGVIFSFRLTARMFGTSPALWSTLAVWLGSSALYYSLVSPTYSHASSMLVVSAVFWYWAASLDRQTPGRYAALGALIGLASLVRWQDAVFLILPLVDAVVSGRPGAGRSRGGASGGRQAGAGYDWKGGFLNLAAAGAATLLVFSPQMLVWTILYGRPLVMPQSEEWMQWHAPHAGRVLFSDWHGLFTWTPIVAVSVAGLAAVGRRDGWIGAGLIAAFLASWWANGSVVEWWAGEAYGARRFVSCFPIFVVGFAAFAEWLKLERRALLLLGGVFAALNLLLLLQYQVFMHGWRDLAPYPRGWYGLWVARFVVPFELLERLLGR